MNTVTGSISSFRATSTTVEMWILHVINGQGCHSMISCREQCHSTPRAAVLDLFFRTHVL
jgi:hypothetical protein